MDESTRLLIKIAAILLPAAVLVWSLWMIRQHWIKKDPAIKHRRTETMMLQPFMMGFCGLIITPLLGWLVLEELGREDYLLQDALLTLGIGLAVAVFFVCYGTRQVVIYDYDHLRYRPVFGKMRTYDFSEIHSMTPIIFDLLVHVGHRWILLDFQQDWRPLWDKYHSWRKRNGLPVKKRTYKTALGRAFGEFPGGIGVLVVIISFFVAGAAFFLFGIVMAWRSGQIGAAVVLLLFAILAITGLVLFLASAVNQEKHPRFSKFMLGDMKTWGKPNRKKAKPKTEEEEDALDCPCKNGQ